MDEILGEKHESELVLSLGSILSTKFPPISWLIDKLIPQEGLVALSGTPGSYKSWLSQQIAISITKGEALFGKFPSNSGGVLVIDKENSNSLIQKRFKLLGANGELNIYFLNRDFFVEDDSLINEVCKFVSEKQIKLVIFDSLIRIYKGKDENNSNDMAFVFSRLKQIQAYGTAILFTHHNRKQSFFSKKTTAESMRGSSDILASVDSALAVEANEGIIKVTQTKLRQDMPISPFKLKVDSVTDRVSFIYEGEIDEEKEKVEKAKDDIYTLLAEGEKSRTELQEAFKGIYGMKTIDGALDYLKDNGVKTRFGDRGKKYFSLEGIVEQSSLAV
ncbi:MAG: AAA family ATPase [Candidatus Microgenomates bacterium]